MPVAAAEKPLIASAMAEIVRAATLAPSPDNNQPWWFVVGDDELTVHLDRQACLPSDVDHMFDLIALGAAIENTVLAAGTYGLAADIEYLVGEAVPDAAERYFPVARIRFAEGSHESPLARWVPDRATNRRPFDTQPIANEKLTAISDTAVIDDVSLKWIEDRAAIKALSKVVAKADGLRFRYQAFHEELYRQLRLTPADVESTRDGLDVRTFELPRPAVWALCWLRSWRRMRALHLCGLGGLLTGPSAELVRASGAIGVLTASAATAGDYLESGRALQRAWLTATSLGLSVHPLGSLPIFLAQLRHIESERGQRDRCDAPVDVAILQTLRDSVHSIIPEIDRRSLVMLFRLGQAAPPSARSLRRPIGRSVSSHN